MLIINDISFYQIDDEGNKVLNEKEQVKTFRIKQGVRMEPFERLMDELNANYLTDDVLEEIKNDC
jgi:hypothetical protein